VTHRVFCVATAIGLLIAPSSAAWAEVEDVGTPGPAILDDASGNSAIANRADALRFDDARFAFRDPSVGSTFLSVGGRFVPIVGAGLEPSQEGQVDPGRPATAFDYNLSGDYFSRAPDAIPAALIDFGAVDANIQSDFMLNGAGDSLMTDPVGGLGSWTTIHGSSLLDLQAGSVGSSRSDASCASDGSIGGVARCENLDIRNALELPAGEETGSSGSYQSGQQDFGFGGATSSRLGAPSLPQSIAGAALSAPPVYFSLANEATLPVLSTVSTPLVDFTNPNVNSNSDPIVDLTNGGTNFGELTQSAPTPSIPELPAPTMIVIGLGGIALARGLRLRSAARLV
jgi:hypothetical protein